MKKLYHEFFCIPEDRKISERVMITRISVTITIIVICLMAMSFSAYAYFSYDVASQANVIRTAHFETMVSLSVTDEYGNAVVTTPATSNYQSYVISLEAGKPYMITVSPTQNCTASTGFVVITAEGCNESYHTWQVWKDEKPEEGKLKTLSFELMTTADTNVYFVANWGTSCYYDAFVTNGENNELYVTQGEQIKMVVNGITESPVTEQTPPVTEQTPPVTEQTPPVTEQTPPVTEQTPPVTEQTPPVTEQTPPVTEQTPPVTEQTPPVTEQTPPVTDEVIS